MKFETAVVALVLLLISCSPNELHLADRHALSFEPVAAFGRAHPGTTLVLFDYHHDSGFGPGYQQDGTPVSYDWVGTLVDRGLVDRVLWVSGRTLLLPNDNARRAWLLRKTSALSPVRRQKVLDKVVLTDSAELFSHRLEGPVTVSLDLDILTKDPGKDPLAFLDEIARWTRWQNPSLVTVALSAAYQPHSDTAWAWLEHLVSLWPTGDRRWILDLGPHDDRPESLEETEAWAKWAARPELWRPATGAFRPGAGVWFAAPPELRRDLLEKKIQAGSPTARDVLRAWNDPELSRLEDSPQGRQLQTLGEAASQALSASWSGQRQPGPREGSGLGVAIRLHVSGHDRGCLALWTGVPDLLEGARFAAQEALDDPRYPPVSASEASVLTVQPSLFGPWVESEGPMDFVAGFHSVMVAKDDERTLIQAPLALERAWNREEFLDALAAKAQLGPDGWKQPGLKWYRAVTIWGELPAKSK